MATFDFLEGASLLEVVLSLFPVIAFALTLSDVELGFKTGALSAEATGMFSLSATDSRTVRGAG